MSNTKGTHGPIAAALRACGVMLAIAAAPLGAQSMGKPQPKPATADSQHMAMPSHDSSMKKSAMSSDKGMAKDDMGKGAGSKSGMKKPMAGSGMQKPDHPMAATKDTGMAKDTAMMKGRSMSKDSTSQMKKPRM